MTRPVLFCVGLGAAFVALVVAVSAFGTPALYALLGVLTIGALLRWLYRVAFTVGRKPDSFSHRALVVQREQLAHLAKVRAFNETLARESRGGYHITPERPS